eukprot:363192-Chlamydomonas_euryale.AAC.24
MCGTDGTGAVQTVRAHSHLCRMFPARAEAVQEHVHGDLEVGALGCAPAIIACSSEHAAEVLEVGLRQRRRLHARAPRDVLQVVWIHRRGRKRCAQAARVQRPRQQLADSLHLQPRACGPARAKAPGWPGDSLRQVCAVGQEGHQLHKLGRVRTRLAVRLQATHHAAGHARQLVRTCGTRVQLLYRRRCLRARAAARGDGPRHLLRKEAQRTATPAAHLVSHLPR